MKLARLLPAFAAAGMILAACGSETPTAGNSPAVTVPSDLSISSFTAGLNLKNSNFIYKAATQTNTEIVRRDPWESYLFLLTGFFLLGFFNLVKYLGIIFS
jgi:uncharacterized lipoprotein YajG